MRIFNYYPHNQSTDDLETEKKIFKHSLLFPFFFLFAFWLVELIEQLFNLDFTRAGIFPLRPEGLPGIVLSPFIHSGFKHLISNSIPFYLLLFTLVYFYRKFSYKIFFQIYLISGLCVWLGGRPAWHIGASGVVYGLAAFHFISGIIRNDVRLLTMSAIVVFLYGGMIWGMLPLQPEISWESHLWGAASGVLLAFYYRKYTIRRKKFDWEEEPDEENLPAGNNPEEPPPLSPPASSAGLPAPPADLQKNRPDE